jgi:hypothetical protein
MSDKSGDYDVKEDIVSKFQTAIVTGDLATFEEGLARGCDPCDNETYWMILHAITNNHIALVDRFLTVVQSRPDRPSDLNKELLTAIEDDSRIMVDLLLDRGARPRAIEPTQMQFMQYNPVWRAVDSLKSTALRRLGRSGHVANAAPYKVMLFRRAARLGAVETFDILEDAYGAPNAAIILVSMHALNNGLRSSMNPDSYMENLFRRRHLDMLYHLSAHSHTSAEILLTALSSSVERDDFDAAHIVLDRLRFRFKSEIDLPKILQQSAICAREERSGIGLLLRQSPEWVEEPTAGPERTTTDNFGATNTAPIFKTSYPNKKPR